MLSVQELSNKYPQTWKYLTENKQKLELREHGKWKHDRWYAFGRSQNLYEMEQSKIITPSIAKSVSFTLDKNDYYYFVGSGGGGGGGYGITIKKSEPHKYEYFLGLLNSKLLDYFLKFISTQFSGGYYAFNRQYIEKLPIYINTDKSRHDRMVELVETMLTLHKLRAQAKTAHDKDVIQRQINATDRQIDTLVYELYGLSNEEIRIVEEGA